MIEQEVVRLPPTRSWCGDEMITVVEQIDAGAVSAEVAILRRPIDTDNLEYIAVVGNDSAPIGLEALIALDGVGR
jgi:hypothetical protein